MSLSSPTARSLGTKRKRIHERLRLTPYLFLLPSLVGVLAFLLLPAVAIMVISFFKWNMISAPHFVGFANFAKLIHSKVAMHSIMVTGYYVVLNIPLQTVLAILFAILLNRKSKWMAFFRPIFVLPWLLTPVAVAATWLWLLNPGYGYVDHILNVVFGINPAWVSSKTLAMPTIALVNIWEFTGYNTIYFLAGLQGIPTQLYEAAEIDGASSVKRFFTITLPLLQPTTMFVLITSVIGSFQVFGTIFVMTQGGPGNSTNAIVYEIYQQAFQFFHMGYASALAVMLFLGILVVTLLQFYYFSRHTTYDFS